MQVLVDPVQHLVDRLGAGLPGPIIIGMVGLPGAGKSTLAMRLVGDLNRRLGDGTAVALGMDGFHLTRAALAALPDPAAALARRGAPWTFDPAALAERLRMLRAKSAHVQDDDVGTLTPWPAFEHGIGDPVADAISVGPQIRLVLLEGLYLLHREHGWNLAGLMDECWYLDVGLEIAMERVTRRHMVSWGIELSPARARVDGNDRLNAGFVQASRARAHWLIGARMAGSE